MSKTFSTLQARLAEIYGNLAAKSVLERLIPMLNAYQEQNLPGLNNGLDHTDAILITYPDQVYEKGLPTLQTLAEFSRNYLGQFIKTIHILPFYPSSSDDGFSVIDYRKVDPKYGDWEDILRLGHAYQLMFDAVINHVSANSAWFQSFLAGDEKFRDYFITINDDPDLSLVVRPRALPLLTRFETSLGEKSLWTTFSTDQVDLNYHNPDVLLEIIEVLLLYAEKGARFIRLDAIAYLWKEFSTSCINLPQTHAVVQILRAVLDEVAPQVFLITETNIPHAENLSYFGDGYNEAQLVYNFALPPLVLYTFQTENAQILSQWAKSLSLPSDRTTFFNFLASHDGIGLNPARGIIPEEQINASVEITSLHGGLVSYKQDLHGVRSPYELNCNYFDALSDPGAAEPIEVQIDRFTAAHAIMLSMVGVPGIYFHSLFGSRGWLEGVRQSGSNRTINRQKFERHELEQELAQPGSLRHQVFERLSNLLKIRSAQPAFHPYGKQRVIEYGQGVFANLRISSDAKDLVLCLQNVTVQPQRVELDSRSLGAVTGIELTGPNREICQITTQYLNPYQVKWIKLNV